MAPATGRAAARAALLRRQAAAAEERKRREVANISDLTTFVVEAAKLDEVDGWERTRLEGVRAEAERRRVGHRVRAGKALQEMRFRGESLAAIAEQAGVSAAVIRSYLRAAATDAPLSGSDGESGVLVAERPASATDGDATPVGRAESPPTEPTG